MAVEHDRIYLIGDSDALIEMRAKQYDSEDLLQELLARYPDLLAGSQMNPTAPRRWLLVRREMGVPSWEGGGAQWSADHLFIDQDGVPTIVEVKRSSDTRIRREVVGQMLDYAANAVRYWPPEQLHAEHDAAAREDGKDPDAVIEECLGATDVDAFWGRVGEHLASGHIRMVFVADEIPSELARVIEFLNEQLRRAEVFGVEIPQYVGGGQRSLVPRIIGATAAARDAKAPRGTGPDYQQLIDAASDTTRELVQRMDDWADGHGLAVRLSRTARQYRDSEGVVAQIYPAYETVEIPVTPIRDRVGPDDADSVLQELQAVATSKRLSTSAPGVPCRDALARWEAFRATLDHALELRAHSRYQP